MADRGRMVFSRLARRAGVVVCLALSLSGMVEAQVERVYEIDLPAQPVPDALNGLSQQTGVSVLFPYDLARNRKSNPVSGRYTLLQGLELALRGTGLSGDLSDNGVLMISTVKSDVADEGEKAMKSSDPASGMANRKPSVFATIAAFLASMAAAPDATGQEGVESKETTERNRSMLEEILVTAQKREQRAFDVPMSIVAMGAEELQLRKITSIDELSLAVPGLIVQSVGPTRRIILRGVSNAIGGSSLIGMYLDEAPVTSSPEFEQFDLRTYDLERVEVLRGPQGTLYGDGSAGGTIRFITKNPVLDRFASNADVAALFTKDGEQGQRIEGMLNMPLIRDELGLRIVGTFDNQGGWIDQPAADRKNFNEQNLVNVRIKGLWQPAPQFSANAMAVIHRNDASHSQGEDDNGNFTQVFNLTTTPSQKDDYEIYNLTLTYDFPAIQVLSTTTYTEQDKRNQNEARRLQLTPPGTPLFHFAFLNYEQDGKTFSEELRLTSLGSGPWQWTLGGFYRHVRADVESASIFGLPGPPGTPLPDVFLFPGKSRADSWAVFGDVHYRLTDRLTLGTGLRYFEDDREEKLSGQEGKFDSLNPRLYVQYKLTDRVNTYASAAKGFRSGGFNDVGQPDFDPETVRTYEVGTKMALLGGRLSADVALFYTDYTDFQINGLDPGTLIDFRVRNAGDVTIKGVEWALIWRPLDQWDLSFNGNYVDSEFDKINAAVTSHALGDPVDNFPEYSYTVSAQRDYEWNGRSGFARVDYYEQGRMPFRNRSVGPWFFDESDVINMMNFHASLQWNDNLSLGLYAQNLLNDRGFTASGHSFDAAPRSRPRTFGIELGVAFD